MNKTIVFGGLVTILAIILGIFLISRPPKANPKLDQFAQCLSDKKLVMYGAYWCPHCQAQKKLLGDSQYIPYVECTVEIKKCQDLGVNSYPTWIDVNGQRYEGEQTLQKLSQITRCQL